MGSPLSYFYQGIACNIMVDKRVTELILSNSHLRSL